MFCYQSTTKIERILNCLIHREMWKILAENDSFFTVPYSSQLWFTAYQRRTLNLSYEGSKPDRPPALLVWFSTACNAIISTLKSKTDIIKIRWNIGQLNSQKWSFYTLKYSILFYLSRPKLSFCFRTSKIKKWDSFVIKAFLHFSNISSRNTLLATINAYLCVPSPLLHIRFALIIEWLGLCVSSYQIEILSL